MIKGWLRRQRKLIAWTGASLAVLLVALAATGYLTFRHLNDNIKQVNLTGLLGPQAPAANSQGQNIVLFGTDPAQGISGSPMLIHIGANKKSAEVMSIPRVSWVSIPSCQMSDGTTSEATQGPLSMAFTMGGDTAMGAACTIKTIEQDTGITVNHFIAVDYQGFQSMVAAVGGVQVCNKSGWTAPDNGAVYAAGCHLLDSSQAYSYVLSGYGSGDGSRASDATDATRVASQVSFVSSLISRAKSQLYNLSAIYRFANAATGALTIDSQLGGVTGLYNLGQELHGIPSADITTFSVPTTAHAGSADLAWKQPQANEIFKAIQADAKVSSSLYAG